jgi:hypothetical protein
MTGKVQMALMASVAIFAGATVWPAAQGQNSAATPQSPQTAQLTVHAKPKNLKVLPKDLSGDDVDKLMRAYNQYLGVPCGYCHEENPETKVIDYASDENPSKDTARFMITMTADINSKYLTRLGDRRYADPITCGNCHRGQVEPPNFELKDIQ